MVSGDHNITVDSSRGEDRFLATQLRRFGSSAQTMVSMLGSVSEGGQPPLDANTQKSALHVSRPHSFGLRTTTGNRRDRRLLALPFDRETTLHGQQTLRGSVRSSENDATLADHTLTYDTEPLEEKLCLEDLRRLMNVFATSYCGPPLKAQLPQKSINRKTLRGESACGKRFKLSCISALSTVVLSEVGLSESHEKGNTVAEAPLPKQELSHSENGASSPSIFSRDGITSFVDTKEKLQEILVENTSLCSDPCESYGRVLSECEFTDAVKLVVPWATDTEIMELMKKVDYEAKGTITWDDFSTFLLSQSRHRSNMDNGINAELITSPEPADAVLSQQHITGTCMNSDGKQTFLLTGGTEGTIRAWNMEKLDSDGVVFAGEDWIVGVHWAHQIQSIIIVTMNRKVIIIDSKTFAVTRLYRGRAVIDSAEGHMYSHESAPLVRIGGKLKPETRRREHNGAAALMRATLKNTNSSSQAPPAPLKKMQQLALLRTGPYMECTLEECTLADLVDAVSCSLFQRSALGEDIVLLGTCIGEVRFYALPRNPTRVVAPHAVLRPHEKRVNKMSIMFENNALLTASDDGSVKMTSLDNGALLHTFATAGSAQHIAVHDFAINLKLRLMVTVGPERYGIVWDFSHDAPMAVLDAHNSPCRCCAMYAAQSQILTCATDGSIFVFDAHSFRLSQVIHTHLRPQCMVYDETRQRLVCLAARPYFHGQRRSPASACLHKYHGHLATMLGVMYNTTYDLVVTIDVEGLVMTWRRSNGAGVFTFHLKDFSGSAVTNAARLTCFGLDGLERRLLTGFNDGTVAVWNLVNGQTTNVITASTESFTITPSNPGVTALGSLTRDGLTFLLFAAAGHLFTTRESSTFTITRATKWPIPEECGEVITLLPVSPQIVVCGCSSGALVFYHVLAERQEGSALWVIDTTADIPTQPQQQQLQHTRRNVGCLSSSTTCGSLADERSEQHAVLTSRVIGAFPLQSAGNHVLMAVHSDGTVALWHTVRRLLMETVNLRGVLPTKTEGGLSHVAVDRKHQYFAFADDAGNVHVCRMELRSVLDEGSLCPPRMQYIRPEGGRPVVQWPGSPFDAAQVAPQKTTASDASKEKKSVKRGLIDGDTDIEARIDPERVAFVFSVFTREYVFHTGMSSISGLCIVDGMEEVDSHETSILDNVNVSEAQRTPSASPAALSSQESLGMGEPNDKTEHRDHLPDVDHPQTSETRPRSSLWFSALPVSGNAVIIVSSGSDNFTRTFTLDGTVIGECGMNTWTLGQPSTYEYLGKKAVRRHTPYYCKTDSVDFLQDAASVKPLSLIPRRRRASRVAIRDTGGTVTLAGGPSTSGNLARTSSFASNAGVSPVSGTAHGEQPASSMTEAPETSRSLSRPLQPETTEAGRLRSVNSRAGVHSAQSYSEKVTLSTRIPARRRSRDILTGIVKSEFISHLRVFPLLSSLDETTHLDRTKTSDSPSNPHGGVKFSDSVGGPGDAPSESSLPLSVANSHAGSAPMASVRNSVLLASGSGGDARGRRPRTPSEAERSERPPSPAARLLTATGAQSRGDATAGDEGRSRALVGGRMEAQRQVLLRLGRTDSVLDALPDIHGPAQSPAALPEQAENSTRVFCSQLLAARRLKATGTAKESKSTVAQITSRLRVFHVDELLPPKGTLTRDSTVPWNDRVKVPKK